MLPIPFHRFCQQFSSFFIFPIFNIILNYLLPFSSAQGLNDPSSHYIEGRLGGRRIWWCPSGYGYLAYCPQPTDWDNYNWKPSCCPFAIPTGAVITLIIASIVLVAVLVGFSCWCCYFCPLYKQLYEYEDEGIEQEQPIYSTQQRQQQQFEE
uniref:LITAF domain-containing protein n=1 Tax=Meloidogyne hapla TaxID=6305 RepID=A0A1I8BXD1_MELHA